MTSQRIQTKILLQWAISFRMVGLPLTRNEARRVDHMWAHPKVPLAEMRGSILILG